MMSVIKVFYFARLKESLNYSTEEIELPSDVETIAELKVLLAQRGETWANLFSDKQLSLIHI